MKEQYLGRDVHILILGEKLNDFKSAHSDIERQRIIKNAIDWIDANPNAILNLY